MKYLLMTLAVLVIFAAPVLADQGNLSHNQLAKLGLSGMSAMSDAQGQAVRGMGFCFTKNTVNVSGNAQVALLCGPVSNAGYNATGTKCAQGTGFATTSLCIEGCPVITVSAFVCSKASAR